MARRRGRPEPTGRNHSGQGAGRSSVPIAAPLRSESHYALCPAGICRATYGLAVLADSRAHALLAGSGGVPEHALPEMGRPKKTPREKDLTARYASGRLEEDLDSDRVEQQQRFTRRSSEAEQNKILRTALMRAADEEFGGDIDALPLGEVVQVHSLFSDVEHGGVAYLCVVRKTLTKVSDTALIVGDRVRLRPTGVTHEGGRPEAVIERIEPRVTVLTRADSFKGQLRHPIVANATRMLIVASIAQPRIKWGLIDRMIIAAQAGGLGPAVCLNKVDLVESDEAARREIAFADEAVAHYARLGVGGFRASAKTGLGLDELRGRLAGQTTVLAGHSGVGKSSLLNAIDPRLDLRVGAISGYTGKGRHTTTSARRYALDVGGSGGGGAVIDTPGVKLFGLWGVTRENLDEFFPDVAAGTAPEWRRQSYERIRESLPAGVR
jgi:ribosome biogenesis GTPase